MIAVRGKRQPLEPLGWTASSISGLKALVCSAERDWRWLLLKDRQMPGGYLNSGKECSSTHKSSKDGIEPAIKPGATNSIFPEGTIERTRLLPTAGFSSRQYSAQPHRDHKRQQRNVCSRHLCPCLKGCNKIPVKISSGVRGVAQR